MLHSEYRNVSIWFKPSKLTIEEKSKYYAGAYLSVLFIIFHILAGLALLLASYSWWTLINNQFPDENDLSLIMLIGFMPIVVLLSYYTLKVSKDHIRLRSIEGGFLSIYSCSIIWEAVVLAHFCAIRKCRDSNNYIDYSDTYIKKLSYYASSLRKEKKEIGKWIKERRNELIKELKNEVYSCSG